MKPVTASARVLAYFLISMFYHAPALSDDWKDSQIKALKDSADATITNLDGVSTNLGSLTRLEDFIELIEENRSSLKGDALTFLEQGRLQIEQALADQKEGLDDFLGNNNCASGSPCKDFKNELSGFFDNLEQITQTLLDINPNSPSLITINLKFYSQLIDQAPGRLIYPLYLGMTTGGSLFPNDTSDYFAQVASGLTDLQIGLQARSAAPPVALSAQSASSFDLPSVDIPDRCPVILEQIGAERFQTAQRIAFGSSLLFKGIAMGLKALGETGFSGQQLGIHGYIGGTMSNNRRKKFGLVIEGVSDSLGLVATHANNTLRYCTVVDNRRIFLDFVEQNQFPGQGPVTKSAGGE